MYTDRIRLCFISLLILGGGCLCLILVVVLLVHGFLLLLAIILLTILLGVLLLLLLLHHVCRGGLFHLLRVQFVAIVSRLFLVGILLRARRNFVCVLFEQERHRSCEKFERDEVFFVALAASFE